ncbi:hypothetical protein SAMN06295888_106146 [Desulfonatronum zhilinae]|nr:hypothetical protein SAMN06295888_106146 [Desulfonatronum zhilinae]
MTITASSYNNKVKAYFETIGRAPSAAQLTQWSQALLENNGNVWRSGLQEFVSNLGGLTAESPNLATAQTLVQNMLTNMFGTHLGVNTSIVNYYVNNLVAGSILPRGLGNAMINDLGLMPRVDGSFGSPSGWNAGPAGVDSPSLLTPAQVNAFVDSVTPTPSPIPVPPTPGPGPAPVPPGPDPAPIPEPQQEPFRLTAGNDIATSTEASRDGVADPFRFTPRVELVIASAGTLTTGDRLVDDWNGDNDWMHIHLNAANGLNGIGTPTVTNIENLMFIGDGAALGTLNLTTFTGVERLQMNGTAGGTQTFNNYDKTGAHTFDFNSLGGAGVVLNASDAIATGYGANFWLSAQQDKVVFKGNATNDYYVGNLGKNLNDQLQLEAGGASVWADANAGNFTATNQTWNKSTDNTKFTITAHGNRVVNMADAEVGGGEKGFTLRSEGTGAITGSGAADRLLNLFADSTFTGGAGADYFGAVNNKMTITDLAAGNAADVIEIFAGAQLQATFTGNWTATDASVNNATAADAVLITAAGGSEVNLSAIDSGNGYTVQITAGNDIITSSGRGDIFSFAATTAGANSITGFTRGNVAQLDVLNFLPLTPVVGPLTYANVAAKITGGVNEPTANIISFSVGAVAGAGANDAAAAAHLITAFGQNGAFEDNTADVEFAVDSVKIFLIATGNGAAPNTNTQIWLFQDGEGAGVSDGKVDHANELTLLGTLVGINAAGLAEFNNANFTLA